MAKLSEILENMASAVEVCRREIEAEADRLYQNGELTEEPAELKEKIGSLFLVNKLLGDLVKSLIQSGVDGDDLKKSLNRLYAMRVIEDAETHRRGALYKMLNKAGVLDE